jgi:hypothetical protein
VFCPFCLSNDNSLLVFVISVGKTGPITGCKARHRWDLNKLDFQSALVNIGINIISLCQCRLFLMLCICYTASIYHPHVAKHGDKGKVWARISSELGAAFNAHVNPPDSQACQNKLEELMDKLESQSGVEEVSTGGGIAMAMDLDMVAGLETLLFDRNKSNAIKKE